MSLLFLVGLLLLDSFTLSLPPLKAYAKYIFGKFFFSLFGRMQAPPFRPP